jgi:hypothetical protein
MNFKKTHIDIVLLLIISFSFLFTAFATKPLVPQIQNPTRKDDSIKPGPDSARLFRTAMMDSVIIIGKKFIGKPYRYRGPSSWALDCAGFAAYLYSLWGYEIPHSAPDQAHIGDSVPLDSLKKGDLMFFKGRNSRSSSVGHTAIFYRASHDSIYFLHSSCSGIQIESYPQSVYYDTRYLLSKRMDLSKLKRVPHGKINLARIDSILNMKYSQGKTKTDANNNKDNNSKVYIIRQGDTLTHIASRFGTSVDTLCKLNNISKTAILRIGQRIILP